MFSCSLPRREIRESRCPHGDVGTEGIRSLQKGGVWRTAGPPRPPDLLLPGTEPLAPSDTGGQPRLGNLLYVASDFTALVTKADLLLFSPEKKKNKKRIDLGLLPISQEENVWKDLRFQGNVRLWASSTLRPLGKLPGGLERVSGPGRGQWSLGPGPSSGSWRFWGET